MGSDASKLLAICIMLLAQRTDNKIPMDGEYIKRFGHLETNPDLQPLIDCQLIEFIHDCELLQDASIVLASCYPEERERRIDKPLSESDNSRDVSFEKFWKAYPKKSGKGAAEKAWKKIKKPSETIELILTAIEWQRKSPQWTKENGQYIPNPATYINQRRWEDEIEGADHEGMTEEEICAANLAAFKERMK